jgi:hypothetical protein
LTQVKPLAETADARPDSFFHCNYHPFASVLILAGTLDGHILRRHVAADGTCGL